MLNLLDHCQVALRRAVEDAYPHEGCGILLGRRRKISDADEGDDEVVRILACPNVDPRPLTRYAIAPESLIAAQKQARAEGLEIVGFYHSHPDHPAQPSETDLSEAHWTGCIYLVCAVRQGKLDELSASRLTPGQGWSAVPVQLEQPSTKKPG